jgi:hypothetical protein
MSELLHKIVETGDLGKSLIMPDVTIHVPMPGGAAVPAPPPPSAPSADGRGSASGGQSGRA